MKRLLINALATVCLILSGIASAQAAEKLQMGVSVDVVPVGSDFSGRDIVIFGAIEDTDQSSLYRGEYDVVIEVTGDLEEAVVRKKDRIGGIWINAAARQYKDVPSFYSVLSRNPLYDVADPSLLSTMGIGVKYLKAKPAGKGTISEFLTQGEFSTALRRKRIENGLFSENPIGIQQISPSLFRATLALPPNVPIGFHTVKAHLFHKGKKLDEVVQTFEVRKIGFEKWIYDLAHQHSLLYGILCVILAISTGWFANLVFRKN
jgi:uncharacterized protein (TIGR02186 family)